MIDSRRLAVPAYLVGCMLIVFPAFDALMSVAPAHFGDPHWRFGAFGLLSNALLLPALGVLILLMAGTVYQNKQLLRAVGILSWVVVGMTLLAFGLFGLDALQTRAAVRPDMRLSFLVATMSGAGKMIVGMIAFGIFGKAGWRSGRPSRQPKSRTPDIVVAPQG